MGTGTNAGLNAGKEDTVLGKVNRMGSIGTTGATGTEPEARNKTLAHFQADKMADNRFTDLMASAGLTSDRMALELLYWLPSGFRDIYERLYLEALAGHDGGANNRGQVAKRDSVLGKATNTGTGKQLKGRRYKKYWTVQNEEVLALKEKVDKRLRAMAREIEFELAELQEKSRI